MNPIQARERAELIRQMMSKENLDRMVAESSRERPTLTDLIDDFKDTNDRKRS